MTLPYPQDPSSFAPPYAPDPAPTGPSPAREGRPRRTALDRLAGGRRESTLPMPQLANLALLLAVIVLAWQLAGFIVGWHLSPNPVAVSVAWGVMIVAVSVTWISARALGGAIPNWLWWLFVVAIGLAVAIDLVAVFPTGDVGARTSVATASGAALLTVVTVRSRIDVVAAATVFAGLTVAAMVASGSFAEGQIPIQVSALAVVLFPAILGVVVVDHFRRFLAAELERVQISARASQPAPRRTEVDATLAALDLEAETLLARVALGELPLPLSEPDARRAGELATALRMQLLAERRLTWLHHAVSESTVLSATVRVRDDHAAATLFSEQQRQGLLSALWLLASETRTTPKPILIEVILGMPQIDRHHGGSVVPLRMRVSPAQHSQVDPAVWAELTPVGTGWMQVVGDSIELELRCSVTIETYRFGAH